MNNENMNNVVNVVTEAEAIMPEVVQDTIEQAVNTNHSNLAAYAVGAGTAVGGYLLGKYVVEPVAKKVKNVISNWWNSRKNTKEEKTEAEHNDNVVPIPEDVEETHRIG